MSHTTRIVVAQALIGLVCAAIFMVSQASQGRAACLALGSGLVPSAYYAWTMARINNPTRLLMHGVLKTLLTLVLVGVSIVVFTVEPLGFFVTLAVMQLAYLVPHRRQV